MRKRVIIVLVGIVLAGCNELASDWSTAQSACEAYVGELLKAPSTYKTIKASHSINRLTKEQFLQLSPLRTMGEVGEKSVDLMKAPGVHTVILQYDAENSFGAPLRSYESCDFLMGDVTKGEYEDHDLLFAAKHKATMETLTASIASMKGENAKEGGCCLADGVSHSAIPANAPTLKTEIR